MKVEIFTLCDYARAELNGKLYIIGVFDTIYSPQEPVQFASLCSVAARLRFERSEITSNPVKTIGLSFVDTDGKNVVPALNAQFPIQHLGQERSATANFVILIPQLNFAKYGEYQIDLLVDSRLEASMPLFVRPPQSGQPLP